MSTQKEMYKGTLKSYEELTQLNYVPSYLEKVNAASVGGVIHHIYKMGNIYYTSKTEGLSTYRLGFREDMFSKLEKQQDIQEFFAKGKVKPKEELIALGIHTNTINKIIALADSKGYLQFIDTAKSDIVVIGDGWTVPYSIFEHVEYDYRSSEGLAGDISESFDEVLLDTPSLTIPENTLEATEHLNSYSAPFRMSNTLFNKVARLRNRTHYIKLQLSNPDLSFRLHYTFEDRPYLEGAWVLKSHSHKELVVVTEDFIKLHFRDIIGITEVIGERITKTNGYSKIIKNWVTKEIINVLEK